MDKQNDKKCPHNFECASKTVKPELYHKRNPLDAENQFYIHIIIIVTSSVRTSGF